jgi:hypothetical protein
VPPPLTAPPGERMTRCCSYRDHPCTEKTQWAQWARSVVTNLRHRTYSTHHTPSSPRNRISLSQVHDIRSTTPLIDAQSAPSPNSHSLMSALTSSRPSDFRSATKDLSRWSSSSADDLANPEIQDAFVRGLHGIAQSYADRAYFRDRMYGALRGVTGTDDQPLLTKSGVAHNKTTLDDERRRLADGMYSVVKSHRDDLRSLRDRGDTKTLGWYADTVRDWAKTYGFDHTNTGSSAPNTEARSRSKKPKHDTALATTKGSSKYDYPNAGMQPTKSALKKSSRRTDGDTSDSGSRSETEKGYKSSKRRREEGASGEGKSGRSGASTRDKRRRQQTKEGLVGSERSDKSQSSDSESESDLRSTTPSKSSRSGSRSRSRQETQPDWEGRSASRPRADREKEDHRGRSRKRESSKTSDSSSEDSDSNSDSGYSSGRRSRSRTGRTGSDDSDRTSRSESGSRSRSKSKSRSGSASHSGKHREPIDDSEEDDSPRHKSHTKSTKSPKSRKDRKDRERKSHAKTDESNSSQSDGTDSDNSAALSKALVPHRSESTRDTQEGTGTGVTSADIESMVAAEVQKRLAHALGGDSPAHPLGLRTGSQYPSNTLLGQNSVSQYPYQPTGYSAPSLPMVGDTWPTQHAQTTQHQLANTGYFTPQQIDRIMQESARRAYVHPSDFKSHARDVITRNFGSSNDGSRVVEFEDQYGNKARGRKYLEAGGMVTTIDYDQGSTSAVSSPRGAMMGSSAYPGGPAGETIAPGGLRSGYDPRFMEYPQSLASVFAPSMSRSFAAPTVY